MFIFVEGPDGAGKTTLVEKLKHQIGNDAFGIPNYEVRHFGVPADPTTQVGLYINEMVCSFKPVTIFDRCWYSDMVYGPVMRGKSGVSAEDCMILEEYVKSIGRGMVFYLNSDVDTLWERCQRRGEDYIKDKEQLKQIHNLYDHVMCNIGLPIYRMWT